MIRQILVFSFMMLALAAGAWAQSYSPDSLLPYIHGVRAKGALLLNARGYEIIVDKAAGNLAKPFLATMFPGFNLHQGYKALPDSSLGLPALRVERSEPDADEPFYSECYFVQKTPETIVGVSIIGARQSPGNFKRAILDLALHQGVPDSLISNMNPPISIPFAGRLIQVDSRCKWQGSNVIQCSGFGELNWSVHPDLGEAAEQTALQEGRNKRDKRFETEQEAEVPVMFEGTAVTAKKIQCRVKGVWGLLAKREGSRILIVYYVTAPVRGRYVSCVLSYWTSDYIEANELPPLLGVVMQLK